MSSPNRQFLPSRSSELNKGLHRGCGSPRGLLLPAMVVHAPHPQSCGSEERPELEHSGSHTHLRLPSQLPLQGARPRSGDPARPYPQNHCLGSGPDNRKLGALSLHCLSFPARPHWRGETAPPPGPPPPAAGGVGVRHPLPHCESEPGLRKPPLSHRPPSPPPSKGQDSSSYHRGRVVGGRAGGDRPGVPRRRGHSLSVSVHLSVSLSDPSG